MVAESETASAEHISSVNATQAAINPKLGSRHLLLAQIINPFDLLNIISRLFAIAFACTLLPTTSHQAVAIINAEPAHRTLLNS